MEPLETGLRVRPQFYVTELSISLGDDGFPVGCDMNGKKVWTESYGLGWRFGIGRDDGHSQDIDIFFDPVLWEPPKGAQVLVARSTRGDHFNTNWTVWSSLSGRDVRRVVSFERTSIAEKPLIRFAVCVGTDEPEAESSFPIVPLRTALHGSLDRGTFVDTQFHVFSKYSAGGGACAPRLVHASSTALKLQTEYFQGLFDNTFGRNDPPQPTIEAYEYSSDSDLEEADGAETDADADEAMSQSISSLMKEQASLKEDVRDKDASASKDTPTELTDGSTSKDGPASKAEPDPPAPEEAKVVSELEKTTEGSSPISPANGDSSEPSGSGSKALVDKKDLAATESSPEKDQEPSTKPKDETAPQPDGPGPLVPTAALRQIYVRDCAYLTWRALIFYLYTGHIAFSPLRSDTVRPRAEFDAAYARAHPHHPAPCSPKSMYRLADKLGLRQLEKLALENLKSALTVDNVVEEYFSGFTAKYEKVQTLELNFMQRHSSIEAVETALQQKQGEIFRKHPELLFGAFTKLLKR